MGSYGTQSVRYIGDLLANEAKLKAEQEKADKYRMPDEQVVTVIMPVGLIRKMVGSWTYLTMDEMAQIRSAMQHALWDEVDVKSDPQESGTADPRRDLPA